MFLRLLNKVLQVKNVYFLFIIIYMILVATNPDTTSGRYISETTGDSRLLLVICAVSALCALVGLIVKFSPIPFWLMTLPFVFYSFTNIYILSITGDPRTPASVVVFFLYVFLALSITWEKINDEVVRK